MFAREHGMKRMNHGGSLGSQHQLQAGLGSNQVMIIYNNINNKTICCVPRTKSKKAQQHSYTFYISFFQQILGSGQNLMGEYGGQEKGILKKSGPAGYCPAMDKDR